MQREPEHYIALAAAMVFVALQHKEKPWFTRIAISGASGGMGYALAADVASAVHWVGGVAAGALTTAFAYAVLDVAFALLADKQAIREALKQRMGGRK